MEVNVCQITIFVNVLLDMAANFVKHLLLIYYEFKIKLNKQFLLFHNSLLKMIKFKI